MEAVIHFEDDTEELQQWDQQVILRFDCYSIVLLDLKDERTLLSNKDAYRIQI